MSHLRNVEYVFVAGPTDKVEAAVARRPRGRHGSAAQRVCRCLHPQVMEVRRGQDRERAGGDLAGHGAFAAYQRGYFTNKHSVSCHSVGDTVLTVVAGPLNYVGANPKVHCHGVPQPSK